MSVHFLISSTQQDVDAKQTDTITGSQKHAFPKHPLSKMHHIATISVKLVA